MIDVSALVVVVDDDASVCDSLARVLGSHGYRVRTYQRAADYLADGNRLAPACVLADVRMPDLDGLEMHRAGVALGLLAPTVFMTDMGDVATVVSAMREGAVDVLEKPFASESLLHAVSAAVERSRAVRAESQRVEELWQAVARLTPREAEVAALVATGRLNKQIAAAIGTSEKTVKVHRARALRKLGVHSVAELVRLLDRALPSALASHDHVPDETHATLPRPLEIIATTLANALPASEPHASTSEAAAGSVR